MKSNEIKERRNRIADIIKEKGRLSAQEASQIFHVSIETIRQDFIQLERMNIVKKVHGGAVLLQNGVIEPIAIRQTENYRAKAAIARKALEYLPANGGIIGMDMGSSVSIFAEMLARTENYMVITNSLPVLKSMAKSRNRVYCLGGEYNAHDMAYQGEQTLSALSKLSLDITFMGTSGLQNRDGICSTDFHDIPIKHEFIKRSSRLIVLADSSKFFYTSLTEITSFDTIDILITDDGIPEAACRKLSDRLQLEIVPVL